jgi:signal transduction histidine kinase
MTTPGVLLMDRGERVKVLKTPLWRTFKGSNTNVWGLADPSKVIITEDSIYRERFKWNPKKLSACVEDSSANVWCTGEDYLYHYQNDSFMKVSETHFGSSLLFYDKVKNEIWLCSNEQRKVYLHTPGTKEFKEIPELEGKVIEQVFFSPSGIIFLKMSYERFYVYQDKKLIQLNGDPSGFLSYAHCVVEDKKGNLWFSSDYGLFRTTLASVKAYLKDQKNKIYYFHYDKSWGFDNNEFNSRGYPCGIITTKGTIAFPSLNGVVEFDPYKTPVQNYKGGMIVESIRLDGERVKAGGAPELRPDFVDLEFQLIHPFFDNPNNIYLSYQLAGYSEEWYRVPKDGKIHFNQLYYGDYTLRVKKQSGFEEEDIAELNLSFTVDKFYYQTYWFFLLLVAIALIAIELVFKWRYSRNRKLRYALEVKVREKTNDYRKLNRDLQENVQKLEDLTESQEEIIKVRREMISIYAHDIRGPLHFIKLISGKAASHIKETSIDTIKEYLEIIKESSSGILNQTEKMFSWNRAHDDDFPITFKWIGLKEVIVDEVKPLSNLAEAKNTKMSCDVSADLVLHTEEDLLRIVINNLVQNAIKYTENGFINISSLQKAGVIQLKVKDTGLGMNSEQLAKVKAGVNGSFKGTKQEKGKGFGLRMVRDILKRLNARMDISSEVGSGTTVCIEFVLNEEGNIGNSQESLLKESEVSE